MSMSTSRIARAVAAKDLRIEMRSRVVTNQVLPFSGLVMIMFAFALDNDDVLQRVAGGLVWLATLFSLFIVVQRTFAVETFDGALDALRVAGVNPQGIFIGKAIALFVQLIVLESVLFISAVVLYRVNVNGSGLVLLVTCVLCATAGLAFVGTLYGGLTAGARGRETLLPLLLLPVVAPVLICATRATESAFRSGGLTVGEGWPWVAVLAVFAAVFGLGGLLSFSSLIEE
ncbi:heme exporter protein B [Actinomycetes bacterium]|nr:heme exporter protein B [Actinomycetes bacterium]